MPSSTLRMPALLLTGALSIGAGLAAAAQPASAEAASAHSTGVVTTSRLMVREVPTSNAQAYGSFAKGSRLTLLCSVQGQAVQGNRTWYQLPGEGAIYVAGRYVKAGGTVPECTGMNRPMAATLTADQWLRQGPSTQDAKVAVARKGRKVTVRCAVLKGLSDNWYYTSDRQWISAHNLKGVDAIAHPGECANYR